MRAGTWISWVPMGVRSNRAQNNRHHRHWTLDVYETNVGLDTYGYDTCLFFPPQTLLIILVEEYVPLAPHTHFFFVEKLIYIQRFSKQHDWRITFANLVGITNKNKQKKKFFFSLHWARDGEITWPGRNQFEIRPKHYFFFLPLVDHFCFLTPNTTYIILYNIYIYLYIICYPSGVHHARSRMPNSLLESKITFVAPEGMTASAIVCCWWTTRHQKMFVCEVAGILFWQLKTKELKITNCFAIRQFEKWRFRNQPIANDLQLTPPTRKNEKKNGATCPDTFGKFSHRVTTTPFKKKEIPGYVFFKKRISSRQTWIIIHPVLIDDG